MNSLPYELLPIFMDLIETTYVGTWKIELVIDNR